MASYQRRWARKYPHMQLLHSPDRCGHLTAEVSTVSTPTCAA